MESRTKKTARIAGTLVFITLIVVMFLSAVSLGQTTFADDSSVIEIRSSADFAALVSRSAYPTSDTFYGKTIHLYTDVQAPNGKGLSSFAGTFNGNGFTVSGLTTSFAKTLASNATIKNLVLTNVNATGSSVGVITDEVGYNGTVDNVSLYGTVTGGCAVDRNNGLVRNVYSYLTVSGSSALVRRNMAYGSIESCFVYSTFTPTGTEAGLLLAQAVDGSSLVDSSFYGNVVVSGTEPTNVYLFGDRDQTESEWTKTGLTAAFTYSAPNGATVDFPLIGTITYSYWKNITDGTFELFTDSMNLTTEDYTPLSSRFYCYNGGYPVNKTLFGHAGTNLDPIELTSVDDVNKLNFCPALSAAGEGFYAGLTADLFTGTVPVVWKTPVSGVVKGNVADNGHVAVEIDPFDGQTYLTSTVPNVTTSSDGYTAGAYGAVTQSQVDGSGTKASPYLVRTAEQLAGLLSDGTKNTSGKYAVILQDILLNKQGNGNNVLSLTAFDVALTLDGCDRTLYNFPTAPFGTVSGAFINANVVLSAHEDLPSGVCATIAAGGRVADVNVRQSTVQTVNAGIAVTNAGTMQNCFNGITGTTYAFAATNTGTMENCISVAATYFTDDLTGVDYCVKEGYNVVGGVSGAGSDYFSLSDRGFDLTNTFGYETGKTETYPTLRKADKTYRVRETETVDPADIGYDELVFNPDAYDAGVIVSAMTSTVLAQVTSRWEYEGNAYAGASLLNAGEYTLYLTFSGNEYITETRSYTVTVTKGTFEDGLVFTSGAFGNLSVSYTGENVVARPTPGNISDLTSAGYVLTYEEKIYNTNTISAVKKCGRYRQTLTATSANYGTLTATRVIEVTPLTLSVSFNETLTAVYGDTPDFLTTGSTILTVSGLVGEDAEKTLYDIVTEEGKNYYSYFTTNYSANGDVGEYETNYTLTATTNYMLSVTKGVLEVQPALITGYSFPNGTYTYDGAVKSVGITGVPAGAAVVYTNNDQTNAGSYDVTATVTHKNYVTLVAQATLLIRQKTITLTVSDLTKTYGYTFLPTDFSFSRPSGMTLNEFNTITSGVIFTPSVEEEGVLDAGTHEVGLTQTGSAQNYSFAVVKGVLTIEKASLYDVFPKNGFASVRTEYTGQAQSVDFPQGAFDGLTVEYAFVFTFGGDPVDEIIDVGTYRVNATVTPTGDCANNYLATTYTKQVTVTLIQPVITFGSSSYTFTYSGTNFAQSVNFPFTTSKMPQGATITLLYTLRSGGETSEFIHAGRYNVVAEYTGDGNYADARATASVTIEPRVAFLTVGGTYVYTGNNLVPEISWTYEGGFEGSLSASDITMTYRGENTYDQEVPIVADAGTYTVYGTSRNSDYTITTLNALGAPGERTIVIDPYPISLALPELSFEYGTVVEVTSNGYSYSVGNNDVTLLGYEVAGTGRSIDIRYRLQEEDVPITNGRSYFPVGRYSVVNDYIYPQKNYTITVATPQTVMVTQRTLRVTWTFNGTDITGFTMSTPYAGRDQTSGLGCKLSNFAAGETEEVVSTGISVMRGAVERELRYVGSYQVYVRMTGAAHYVLDTETTMLSVTITKAAITSVLINNGSVMQYESLVASFTVDGLRGEDIGKSPYSLPGFSFQMVTNYNPSSATPGEVYRVSGTFLFDNYVVPADRVQSGTYTVIAGYKQYSMTDTRYVYDGTDKTVLVGGVETGVTVIYGADNVQKNAGTYTLTATVRYPTGRSVTLSCKMTIEKATPIVTCPIEYGAFKEEYRLTEDLIHATATLGGGTVPGSYEVVGSDTVKGRRNTFSVRFVPTDTKNIETVTFTKTMVLYVISGSDFGYSHNNFTVGSDGEIRLSTPLEITFDKSDYPEIAEGLELYQNAVNVSVAVLNRTAKEVVEVRYKGETVYTIVFNVLFNQTEEKKEGTVEVDERLLDMTSMDFSNDGLTIFLKDGKGTIALSSEYKDRFILYVDGEICAGSYELTSDKKSVSVAIVNKSLGVSMFSKTFNVQNGTDPSKQTTTETQVEEGWFKPYYYYIIGGVGGGLLLIIIVVVIMRRR